MKKLVTLAAGLALAAGVSTAAQAQTCTIATTSGNCTVNNTVTATAPAILSLTLSSTSQALGNPTAADFDAPAGVTSPNQVTATMKVNRSSTVTLGTAASSWTFTPAVAGDATTKALSDLRWSLTGASPWSNNIGTSGTVIAASKGSQSGTVTWNTLWNSSTDAPGAYSLVTVFTLTTP